MKVTFPYSPINSSSLPWMIAQEAGLFEKHGLDVELVYMGASSLILQSMLSGSANIAGFAGPAIINNVLKGGDIITVAALTPLTQSLMVKRSIEKAEDLKGRKFGLSRLGAVPHFAIKLILERYGVKDATILQMGGQTEAAAALRRGLIDGAMASPPHSYLLAKDGFRELVGPQEYSKLGIKFISQGIAVSRSFAVKNRGIVVQLIKATVEAVRVMFVQERVAKRALAKYARQTDPELLDRLYKFALETVNKDPAIQRDAISSMARVMVEIGLADQRIAAQMAPEAFYDNSFIDEVKRSGFLAELWK